MNLYSCRLSSTLHYPDSQSAIEAAFVGGPVALAYDRFDTPTREAVHREYLASIEAFRTPAGYSIPGEFVVCRGRKGKSACPAKWKGAAMCSASAGIL
ncbi:MAG: hypothetical protein ROR55_10630 [Devosia sp.]